MTDINLVNPTSNQILIYNEITGSFDNADLTPDLIKDFTYVKGAISIGTVGSAAVYKTISSTLDFVVFVVMVEYLQSMLVLIL